MANRGIYTGMLDVWVARMIGEDTVAHKPTYDVPQVLGMGIEVTITPAYQEGSQYASNVIAARTRRINNYGVTINTASMDPAIVAYATGRTMDVNGVQMIAGSNQPGKIALGFVRTKDNGKKELWWLYKGELSEAEVSARTATDSLEYQTPVLEGTFDRRVHDDMLAVVADEDDANVSPTVIANWMSAVYEPDAPVQLDPDTLPIGAVETVAALPTENIGLHTVYVLTATDDEKEAGTMWRHLNGTWVQYNEGAGV